MPSRCGKTAALLLTMLMLGVCENFAAMPDGFTALFNGRNLEGWRGGSTHDPRVLAAMSPADRAAQIEKWNASLVEIKDGHPHWRVEGGELINDGLGGYATTAKDYGDFEFRVDWKITAGTDSGIYLRGVPQVQIWDPASPDPKGNGNAKGSGGLWNNDKKSPGRDPLVKADNPVGTWNTFRIRMVGSRVSVWLNGKLVVDHVILENYYDKKLPEDRYRPVLARGPIQLQTHGGETRWRNIMIREIGSDEACKILAKAGKKGFEPVFNGRNLDGWSGATDAVAVQDGALVWQRGKGGVLYTDAVYSDFKARVWFKVPPAGNNGLAIRYPGTGNPAYEGMCELQIIDQDYESHRGPIDPRQQHGSAYGMVAAQRGYQHPVGDWNFEEVTVQGSSVKVELNGTVILDTDLGKVDLTKVLQNKAHPGKELKSGHFGFAGHNDPVAFKNVLIKRL
ncbi:MAG: DUF1080 domain-containing protein [Opitutaceae bacterium]|nr:DUF1080 domain-containing protein [Opitutaceae bacterium]